MAQPVGLQEILTQPVLKKSAVTFVGSPVDSGHYQGRRARMA